MIVETLGYYHYFDEPELDPADMYYLRFSSMPIEESVTIFDDARNHDIITIGDKDYVYNCELDFLIPFIRL